IAEEPLHLFPKPLDDGEWRGGQVCSRCNWIFKWFGSASVTLRLRLLSICLPWHKYLPVSPYCFLIPTVMLLASRTLTHFRRSVPAQTSAIFPAPESFAVFLCKTSADACDCEPALIE